MSYLVNVGLAKANSPSAILISKSVERPVDDSSSVEVIGTFSRSSIGNLMLEAVGKSVLDCAREHFTGGIVGVVQTVQVRP